jgi:hypothetical protein
MFPLFLLYKEECLFVCLFFTAVIGTTAGIISPIVAGLLTKDQICTLIT